jgi:outer membrane biogenesis lipoprotein LolB
MKTAALAILVCSVCSTLLLGCADARSARSANADRSRSEAYYSGKPDTVREAERVDGRGGAGHSAPPAGAPASPVPVY